MRAARSPRPTDETLIILLQKQDSCVRCRNALAVGDIAQLAGKRVICQNCCGWGGYVWVPSGDATLTRRLGKSGLAVAVKAWNKRKNRWERRGTLAPEDVLADAQASCAMDEDQRAITREKSRARAAVQDQLYIQAFADALRREFPSMPAEREYAIARHACEKHSGRVGRTAAAKQFDREMMTVAVIAHIRHLHTDYDYMLDGGVRKRDARDEIRRDVQKILTSWRTPRKDVSA